MKFNDNISLGKCYRMYIILKTNYLLLAGSLYL